jgi:hypothetical protein
MLAIVSNLLKFLLAVLIFKSCAVRLWANGFGLPDQDAFAMGRGEAFVATADNPSAIYYNPAGITQLKGDNLGVAFMESIWIQVTKIQLTVIPITVRPISPLLPRFSMFIAWKSCR